MDPMYWSELLACSICLPPTLKMIQTLKKRAYKEYKSAFLQ